MADLHEFKVALLIKFDAFRVDRKKQFSITKKLASLCAADVSLKEFAQRVKDLLY
jgi:hypothetical protein